MSDSISHLTFDCYGTLIDWEQGILAAVKPFARHSPLLAKTEDILQSFVAHEARIEAQAWRPYREVLYAVMKGMAADFSLRISRAESKMLAESLPDWPPFLDTVAALKQLAKRFRLAIVSNTDDALFTETQKRLIVPFDAVITAEQVRSYKPGRAHFLEAIQRLGVPAAQILHVAQSLYHDHVPAKALGFRTAWIRRPSLLAGTGLSPEARVKPDWVFDNLAEFANWLAPVPYLPALGS